MPADDFVICKLRVLNVNVFGRVSSTRDGNPLLGRLNAHPLMVPGTPNDSWLAPAAIYEACAVALYVYIGGAGDGGGVRLVAVAVAVVAAASAGAVRGRGRRRRWRRRGGIHSRRNVTDNHGLLRQHPLNVGAHAFRYNADRDDDDALVDFRRNVERAAFTVDDDFGFSEGDFDVGTRLGNIRGLRRGIVRNGRAHLLEHRAQWDEDRRTTDQRCKDAVFLQRVRLRVDDGDRYRESELRRTAASKISGLSADDVHPESGRKHGGKNPDAESCPKTMGRRLRRHSRPPQHPRILCPEFRNGSQCSSP